jgi:glycosyltransferase involved in cell wall biosynthesis
MYQDGLRCLRRRAVVWTAHNLQMHNTHDAALDRRSIQALIDVCDGIIVLSGASGKVLRSEYSVADRTIVEVIHHGHYIGCYPNAISREAARDRLGIPGDARVVISLGRLQPYKGLEALLKAFESVARSGDVLILAGRTVSPAYASRLHQAIRELRRQDIRVLLQDAVIPDDEIQVYFNACDVVALPFSHVLNSGSLLLAMSFGCPVVAPALGSIPEVACPEGWFGYCPTSPGSLPAALETALRSPNLEALRKRVMDFTANRYDWSRVGQLAMALYRRVRDTSGA